MFEKLGEFFGKTENLVGTIIIASMIVLVLIVNLVLRKLAKSSSTKGIKFLRARIVNSILSLIIICVAIAIILEMNGVNITAFVTGLGVITIVVAFAIQDFLKDTVSGLFILIEGYFKIGDVISYDGNAYEVVDLSLKVTKLKNIETEDVFTISNHLIEQVKVLSGNYLLTIPGAYDYKPEMMRKICKEIAKKARHDSRVKECKFIGTNAFQESQIDYTLEVKVIPIYLEETKRMLYGLIQDVFEENKIEIPFNQIDVHVKK